MSGCTYLQTLQTHRVPLLPATLYSPCYDFKLLVLLLQSLPLTTSCSDFLLENAAAFVVAGVLAFLVSVGSSVEVALPSCVVVSLAGSFVVATVTGFGVAMVGIVVVIGTRIVGGRVRMVGGARV